MSRPSFRLQNWLSTRQGNEWKVSRQLSEMFAKPVDRRCPIRFNLSRVTHRKRSNRTHYWTFGLGNVEHSKREWIWSMQFEPQIWFCQFCFHFWNWIGRMCHGRGSHHTHWWQKVSKILILGVLEYRYFPMLQMIDIRNFYIGKYR